MVYKIIHTKWGVFLEALIFTILIFNVGLFVGYLMESSRANSIADSYKQFEVESLDLKLQSYYFQTMDASSCDVAINQNIKFADDIYNTGLELQKYEENNQITDQFKIEKKRYVLLKTELWLNSIALKKKCNNSFDTLVYIYSADPGSSLRVSEQKAISNVLTTIKEQKGNNVVLLPIAGDLKLRAIDMQLESYNITSLPVIMINEQTVLYGFHDASEIEKYLTK